MQTHLTQKEINTFWEQGFVTPKRVFSDSEVSELRREFEDFESHQGGEQAFRTRSDMHLFQQWAWDVVHDRRIVDPISDLLGPNVLLWSLNWFIKEARDRKFVSFHQDATYWGLYPYDVVSAWVALSDASEETGPMHFVSRSHNEPIREHEDTFGEDNLLSRGQVISGDIPAERIVFAPLHAGEMSLHHVCTIHGSNPNETDDRRIGMVLRYCATHVKQTKIEDTAVLVKGEDEFNHFELLPQPQEEFGEAEMARHRDALRRRHRALHSKDYEKA